MPVRRERRSDLLADILRLSSTGNRTVSRKKARDALLTLKNLTDLVNEYCGASNAAFVAMEQVEDFSSHARTAKANRDWRDEQDLWDAASRLMLSSIKHRD